MNEPAITTLPETLVESAVHQSKAWLLLKDPQSQQKLGIDILAMPERMNEVPEWIRMPLFRYLRLKQRNWPAKTVQRSTNQLFNRLHHIINFFIKRFEWSEWQQLSPHWLDEYVDTKLREGKKPGTINWDLIYFKALCQFLIDEGTDVPESIMKVKMLNTPQRLPRPLSAGQVRRVEGCIQSTMSKAKTKFAWELAVRDLVVCQPCFDM